MQTTTPLLNATLIALNATTTDAAPSSQAATILVWVLISVIVAAIIAASAIAGRRQTRCI